MQPMPFIRVLAANTVQIGTRPFRTPQKGPVIHEFAGARIRSVALDFGDPQEEAGIARRMGLADISPLPHTGFKGAGAAEWLARQGVDVPQEPNWATALAGGGLAVRQADAEIMILGDLSGEGGWPERLKESWWNEPVPPEAPRGFPMPRDETHAWFLVTGEHAAAMFAKICAVDLRAAVRQAETCPRDALLAMPGEAVA